MIRHLLKITLRNIAKTKLYAFINILGLSLGIACAVLIILFVKDELTFDNFHSNKENLYRVFVESERRDGSMNKQSVVPMIAGPSLQDNYPDVANSTIWYSYTDQVTREEESYEETINMASPSFFKLFDFEVYQGSTENAFSNPTDIIITKRMADKYFGDEPALGKTLSIPLGASAQPFEIKAVLQNIPSNSSLQFDFLISNLAGDDLLPEGMMTSWNFVAAESYVLLSGTTDAPNLEAKFPEMIQTLIGESLNGRKYDLRLQPILDVHLDSDMPLGIAPVSDPKYTVILSTIAFLILMMGCINFMNLSLGRSITRAREIGVKKVVGANRVQIMIQFLSESILLSLFGLAAGVTTAYWALPTFNQLSGKELLFDLGQDNIIMFTLLAFGVGILAGIYPALVMSGFKPVNILKGSIGVGGGAQGLRKVMITIQLVLSVFMITSALFMKSQLSYMSNKNLGFNKDQLVVLPITTDARGIRAAISSGMEKAERGKPAMEALGSVEKVGISSHHFEEGSWIQVGYTDEADIIHNFFMNTVDANYIDVLEMKILEGRGFQVNNESDKRRSIVVNEAFVKEYNLESAIGGRIPHESFPDHEIIGVVEDFHFASLHTKVEPLILTMNPDIAFTGSRNISLNSSFVPKLIVKLKAGEISTGMSEIQSKWDEIYPGEPLNYSFMDDTIQAQYERERNLDTTISYATGLAVIIGLLGLFGLATLTMNARLKEMSVRKVLGAGEPGLVFILSKPYLFLVLVATIISIPITYYFIDNWLQNFEYKISIGPSQFIVGAIIVLFGSFLTLSYQSIKIALSRPIDILQRE